MKNRAQVLGPGALAILQECLDTMLARYSLNRGSDDANAIAATLLQAYIQGVTDHRELVQLADIERALRLAGLKVG